MPDSEGRPSNTDVVMLIDRLNVGGMTRVPCGHPPDDDGNDCLLCDMPYKIDHKLAIKLMEVHDEWPMMWSSLHGVEGQEEGLRLIDHCRQMMDWNDLQACQDFHNQSKSLVAELCDRLERLLDPKKKV